MKQECSAYKYLRNCYYENKRKTSHWKNLLTDHGPKFLILTYHRIMPQIAVDPLDVAVTVGTFMKQVEALAKRYPVISLSDALKQCRAGQPKAKIQIVFTFDDGYADIYQYAFPLLKKRGLPATVFLITDYIGKGIPLWEWEVSMILSNKRIKRIQVGEQWFHKSPLQLRQRFLLRIIDRIKSLDVSTRQKTLDALKDKMGDEIKQDEFRGKCLTWGEVRQMCASGIEFGSHGLSHSSLSRIPFSQAIQEIKVSKEIIESNTAKECFYFAFPFGSKKDYNDALIEYVKKAGFKACLLNIHGFNQMKKDVFCLKRVIMGEYMNLRDLLG